MSGAPSHPLGWRPLTVTLIGVGAVLVFAAVLSRDPVPIFVALPLLLAPIAAGVVGPRRSPRIRMALSIEGAAAEVLLRGTIAPPPGVDARDLFVEFERPASLKERSPPKFERSESEVRFWVDWIAPEPIITEVRPPMVLWRDPMGLVERPTVSSAATTVISRYPPELSTAFHRVNEQSYMAKPSWCSATGTTYFAPASLKRLAHASGWNCRAVNRGMNSL